MSERESESEFVAAPGFVVRRVAGEVLLVSTGARSVQPIQKAAELLVLNETGAYLWERLAEPSSAEALARHLIQDFEVEPTSARTDVERFLASLIEVGAVVRANKHPVE
ncbi:MAG TPA: PqqD family protein [Gemmatimonadaceae bacterium]|nr:PqqD family protein [Gemmatimonadaceae bacterium]